MSLSVCVFVCLDGDVIVCKAPKGEEEEEEEGYYCNNNDNNNKKMSSAEGVYARAHVRTTAGAKLFLFFLKWFLTPACVCSCRFQYDVEGRRGEG